MSVLRGTSFLEGLRNTRQAQGDGTLQGRVRSAMPYGDRPVGGKQEAATPSTGPSVRIDTLTLTANSQAIADTSDDVTWHNELVGLTPREGFDGYAALPSDTVTIAEDGRLFASLYLNRTTTTAWTVRYHVTRSSQTFTFDVPGPTSGGSHLVDPPHLTVQAGDVLRVRIVQTSGGAETLDSATLHLTLFNVSPRSEPPAPAREILMMSAGVDDLIYKLGPSDGSELGSFASPSTTPHGLAWDGTNLWHCDFDSDLIYKLDPSDGTVLDSFATPSGSPQDLAWDGTNLWHCDTSTDLIYKLDPSDGTVLDSFASPSTLPRGLTWDGSNLWHSDAGSDLIYKLDPSDGSTVSSFSSPGSSAHGLAWDGTNLWHADSGTALIYKLDPSDGSVLDSFTSPDAVPRYLTWKD